MEFADDSAIAARLEKVENEISGLVSQFDVFRFLKHLTESRGLRAFMVVSLPNEFAQELAAHTLITNWPTELLSQYDQGRLITKSPLFRRLRTTSRPFHFDSCGPGSNETYGELFERFGMRHGLWFPAHNVSGEMGAVGFFGENPPATLDRIELLWIGTAVYDQLHAIGRKVSPARELLTEREAACLTWTSAGKTSAEIAEILGLSEHTVNHYLNRVTRKLDAVNRTQAVAKALRQHIIK